MNQNQRGVINIYSSYKLSEEEIKIIREKFSLSSDKKIINLVNEDLLGGIIILENGKKIDLSLKTLLKNLEKQIYELG